MANLHKRLGDKIEFIGVNVGGNERLDGVKKYVKENAVSFTNIFDKDKKIIKAFGVMGTPTHIVIDRKGVVRYMGVETPDDIEKHMKELLM